MKKIIVIIFLIILGMSVNAHAQMTWMRQDKKTMGDFERIERIKYCIVTGIPENESMLSLFLECVGKDAFNFRILNILIVKNGDEYDYHFFYVERNFYKKNSTKHKER